MLESSDLLQIDATIIAGILILLTISSFIPTPTGQINRMNRKIIQKIGKKTYEFTPYSVTAFIVMPFAVSAILIIIKQSFDMYQIEHQFFANFPLMYLFSTGIGFVYLLWVVIVIARNEP